MYITITQKLYRSDIFFVQSKLPMKIKQFPIQYTAKYSIVLTLVVKTVNLNSE